MANKSSLKNVFKNFFQFIDIYGSNVRLYIRGTHTYQTPLGGILTFLLALLVIIFSIDYGKDLFKNKNPKLINYKNHYDLPITINSDNLTVSFMIYNNDNSSIDLKNNKEYSLDIFHLVEDYFSKDSNNQTDLKFDICKNEKFKNSNQINLNDPNKINNKVINYIVNENYYCIKFNDSEFFGSPFQSLRKKSIKLNFNLNSTLQQEDMKKKFPIKFKIFYQAFNFELENYDSPLKLEYAYKELNLYYQYKYDLYMPFNRANLTRDDSLILSSTNNTSILGFNNIQLISIPYNQDEKNNSNKNIFSVEMYLDNFEEIYIRRYDKIADVAAQVTAMARIIYIFFQLITMLYTFDRINEQLAFKFYKYKFENQATPDELYNRRKTMMQKELSIKVPKKDRNFSVIDRNFDFLYNDNIYKESKKSHISRFFQTPTYYKIYDARNKMSNFDLTIEGNEQSFNEKIKSHNINEDSNRSADSSTPKKFLEPKTSKVKKDMYVIESSLKNNIITKDINNDPISKKYKDHLILNFNTIFQKQDKLTFRDKIKLLFNCIEYGAIIREKNHFYLKAKSKIQEKLDIIYILNKLDEFDKFKMMYLNPYQFLALSYCKKANILNTNYSNLIDFYQNFCEDSDEKKNIINILEYFIYKIRKRDTDILDKKLLEMIEPEILKAIYENID